MGRSRFTPEFKAEAVRQVLERGYTVKDVAERIGVSAHALYIWVRKARPVGSDADEVSTLKLENQKLKAELKRVEEERDILKKRPRTLQRTPSEVRVHPRARSAPGCHAVPHSSGPPQRILCVAEAAPVGSCHRGRAPAGQDPPVPSGERRSLRQSADLQGPAR